MIASKCWTYFIGNKFAEIGGLIFKQAVGIHLGTDCGHLLVDLIFTHVKQHSNKTFSDQKTRRSYERGTKDTRGRVNS